MRPSPGTTAQLQTHVRFTDSTNKLVSTSSSTEKKNQTGRSFSFLVSCVHSTPTIVAFFTHTQTKMLYNIYIFSSSAMLRDELLFFYFIITTAASHIVTIHLYCFIISSCCGRETSWRDVQKFIFILNNARAQLIFFFSNQNFFVGTFLFPPQTSE